MYTILKEKLLLHDCFNIFFIVNIEWKDNDLDLTLLQNQDCVIDTIVCVIVFGFSYKASFLRCNNLCKKGKMLDIF